MYDVSHSTPVLPLSIFVSVPGADERHAELRLAESIIHEAMHLQLTFIESLSHSLSRPERQRFRRGSRAIGRYKACCTDCMYSR